MPNLIINKLIYTIETEVDTYGADITFTKGLNIIFGPNSVGKTSIITGIIYGLCAEKGLGIFKSMQNPFKPEFYDSIENKRIKKSHLILEISNGIETISIYRVIAGGNINLVTIKECKAEDYFITEKYDNLTVTDDVFSEHGFQNFLFNFLQLEKTLLPTYNAGTSKLYFENILPLFFVEQRAGWSQIQARQVTRYNIKDIKNVVFEYLMGLDKFEIHLKELEKKSLDEMIKLKENELDRLEESLLIIANANKIEERLIINSKSGDREIRDYTIYLQEIYNATINFVNQNTSQGQIFEEANLMLRNNIKSLDNDLRQINERIEKTSSEIKGYENYIERININRYKNKQLKNIQELSNIINIKSCPVCESPLGIPIEHECILCHSDLSSKISTPEQNLVFLEDEENTFKKVLKQRIFERSKLLEHRSVIKDNILLNAKQLEHQTNTYAGKELSKLRERMLEADSILKEIEKYSRIEARWNNLESLRIEIKAKIQEQANLVKKIKEYQQTNNDFTIINKIKSYISSNLRDLGLFKNNQDLIDKIKLDSSDNYSPYLENFDIYNISSSSDNIRIILSYYLSLLQTSVELKSHTKIKFPNLLIFDEPKQQNLDNSSLINCIDLISNIPSENTQVILTTYSDKKEDKDKFEQYIVYEMKDSTDYLLKKRTID